MKKTAGMNPLLTVTHLLCLFVLSYTLIIKNIFSTTDTLNTHLQQAGVYANVSNLVKARLSDRIDQRFQDKILQRTMSIWLLDRIVTPQFIEKQSQRVLPVAATIISKPLDIENNKVVVDTKTYKQKLSTELAGSSQQIPDIIEPTVKNLAASIPDQLALVDMSQRPNSILGFLTKAKILYENINLWNTIALTLGIVTGLLLLIINWDNLRSAFKNLSVAYLVAGAVVFIGSYLFPYLLLLMNSGQNIYLNQMVSDVSYYFFALTRTPSIILVGVGGVLYLLSRWSYVDALQMQVNKVFQKQHSTSTSKRKVKATA